MEVVQTADEFNALVPRLSAAEYIGIEFFTHKDDECPWMGGVLFLALSLPDNSCWAIDGRQIKGIVSQLKPLLEKAFLVAHGARRILRWLSIKYDIHPHRVFCTLTAGFLLKAGKKYDGALESMLEGCQIAKIHKQCPQINPGELFLGDDQLGGMAERVAHLIPLMKKLKAFIESAKLTKVCDLEMDLIPAISNIETVGFPVNRTKLTALIKEMGLEREKLRAKMETSVGKGINFDSPEQVLNALMKVGIALENTKEESLKQVDHPVVSLLLEYRAKGKIQSQATGFLDVLCSDDRIRAQFDPLGTETGRFSSRSPNLQNLERGKIRESFEASAGRVFVIADYSQIELRAAAVIAKEPKMIDAFQAGADLHCRTAALVLDKPEAEVSKADRQLAKAVNFGLLYGQAAKGLVHYAKNNYGVTLTEPEANKLRNRFFEQYQGIQKWHGDAWTHARNQIMEVRTVYKRRRWLPEEPDRNWDRFTGLVNTEVQGGCADGMKLAIIRLNRDLPKEAKMIATVHDELVVECPEQEADKIKKLVQITMVQAMEELFKGVPIVVDTKICRDWGEK